MVQPGRARRPGCRPARASRPGSLPRQPGPARHPEAGQRPGRILDRGVGDPRPPGHTVGAGGEDRGHLARAVLGCRRGAGRAGRGLAAARRGAHRDHRAGHGVAAARRVAGDREAPQRPGLGGLARRRDRHRIGRRRPAPVVVLAGARHAGDRPPLVGVRAAGADPRDHDGAARALAPACCGSGSRRCSASTPAAWTSAAPGPTPRSGWPRSSSCGGSTRHSPPRSPTGSTCGTSRKRSRTRPWPTARPAIAWCCPPTGRPGPRTRPRSSSPGCRTPVTTWSATSASSGPGSPPAPAASPDEPASRADARRRGAGRRGPGGQPVPQGVPGQARSTQGGASAAESAGPDRVGRRVLPRLKRTVREHQQPVRGRAPAAHPGVAGA